jgi:hypothetical protein
MNEVDGKYDERPPAGETLWDGDCHRGSCQRCGSSRQMVCAICSERVVDAAKVAVGCQRGPIRDDAQAEDQCPSRKERSAETGPPVPPPRPLKGCRHRRQGRGHRNREGYPPHPDRIDVVTRVAHERRRNATDLDEVALDESSTWFGVDVPTELRLFLGAGVPTSPKWAKWVEGPDVVLGKAREWIARTFDFDIRQNTYWHPLFGPRPADDDAAVAQALEFVGASPPLLPVYGHRFLATQPTDGPRAVLSVWQAVDSIFYGNDLADYFAHEFRIDRPAWATSEPPPVPVWEDLFDL